MEKITTNSMKTYTRHRKTRSKEGIDIGPIGRHPSAVDAPLPTADRVSGERSIGTGAAHPAERNERNRSRARRTTLIRSQHLLQGWYRESAAAAAV